MWVLFSSEDKIEIYLTTDNTDEHGLIQNTLLNMEESREYGEDSRQKARLNPALAALPSNSLKGKLRS